MAGNYVHARIDAENKQIIINVVDSSGARVTGTAQINLDLALLEGTDKDMEPREIIYQDASCNWKKRWVLCTDEEDAEAPA